MPAICKIWDYAGLRKHEMQQDMAGGMLSNSVAFGVKSRFPMCKVETKCRSYSFTKAVPSSTLQLNTEAK